MPAPGTRTDDDAVTGLVLAGGQGRRMGGVDKGLQPFRGKAMVEHALERLAPQVEEVLINANRNLGAYESFGAPVWPDADVGDYSGPLAGFLAGLERCEVLDVPGGHPYAYGEWLSAPGAPTLLLYAHHDVQPPGRASQTHDGMVHPSGPSIHRWISSGSVCAR